MMCHMHFYVKGPTATDPRSQAWIPPWEGHLGSDTSGTQKFDMVFRILGSELASVPNLSPIGESGHVGSTRSWGILGPGPRTPGVDLTLGSHFFGILGSELAMVPNLSPIGESGHLGSTRSWDLAPGPLG